MSKCIKILEGRNGDIYGWHEKAVCCFIYGSTTKVLNPPHLLMVLPLKQLCFVCPLHSLLDAYTKDWVKVAKKTIFLVAGQ